MKTKKDDFYFQNLDACIGCSYEAALFLKDTLKHFDRYSLPKRLKTMHGIEHKADILRHQMMEALSHAFVTPIEREDFLALSNYLDDITDAVEEVLLQVYMSNVDEIHNNLFPVLEILIECIKTLTAILKELKHFRHSNTITGYIIKVNDLEEQADELYKKYMHDLYKDQSIKNILTWSSIYEYMENCIDTCEHAADIAATVIMKNS